MAPPGVKLVKQGYLSRSANLSTTRNITQWIATRYYFKIDTGEKSLLHPLISSFVITCEDAAVAKSCHCKSTPKNLIS